MSDRTPSNDRYRIRLRVVGAGVAYVVYLLLDQEGSRLWAGVTGIGTLLFAWTLIDRRTVRRAQPLGLLEAGAGVLGLALMGLGLLLVLGP